MRRLLRLLVVVLVAMGLLSLALPMIARHLIFHPTAGEQATPAERGLEYAALRLSPEAGLLLTAWYLPAPGARRTVLYLHGNAGNLSDRVWRLARLASEGLAVLAFDYRGFGLSEGRPSVRGTGLDARAAWDHLTGERGLEPGEIVLVGSSLGAAVALQLVESGARPAAVILEAPFASIRAMSRAVFPLLPAFLVPDHYDNLAAARRLDLPLAIYHGTADQVVPFEQGRRLFEAAAGPKSFFAIEGGPHQPVGLVAGFDWMGHLAALARGEVRIGD